MLNSTAVHARAGGMLRGTVGTRLMPSFVEYSNGVPHGATSGRAPHNYGVLRSFSGNLRAWLPHAHRPRSAPQIPGVHLCRVYDTRLANADRARAAPKVASLLQERAAALGMRLFTRPSHSRVCTRAHGRAAGGSTGRNHSYPKLRRVQVSWGTDASWLLQLCESEERKHLGHAARIQVPSLSLDHRRCTGASCSAT